jgi:hypothetical protein
VPKEVVEQFRQEADRESKQASERRQAESKAALEQIEKALAKERASVEGQLKKQPDYAAYRKALDPLLARKPNTAAEVREQTKALAQLHRQHQKMYVTAYRAAQIDEKRVLDVLSRACRAKVAPIQGGPGTYRVLVPDTSGAPAQKGGVSHAPPYPGYSGSQHTYGWGTMGGPIENYADATPATGRCHMYATAFAAGPYASGSWNDASVGSFFLFSASHSKKLTVTIKTRAAYDVTAFALGGGSYADAHLFMRTGGPTSRKTLAWVLAPLLWLAEESGNEYEEFTKTSDISSSAIYCGVRAGAETSFTAYLSSVGASPSSVPAGPHPRPLPRFQTRYPRWRNLSCTFCKMASTLC